MWCVESSNSGIYEVEFPLYDQIVRFELPARDQNHALNQALARWLKRRGMSISENIGAEMLKWERKARIRRIGDAPDQKPGKIGPVQQELPGIQAFDKIVNKEHPGTTIAESWKKSRKMRFLTFDQLAELIGSEEAFLSVKLDGELVALVLSDGKVEAVTSKGTVRSNFPAAIEAAKLLGAKYKNAILMAEMYVVNEDGTPQSYMKASKTLRDPDAGQDNLIRLSVFDIIKLNETDYEEKPIEEKMTLMVDLTKNNEMFHPAYTVKGGIAEAKKLWKQLEQKGWEGLVVHIGDQLYKVKPIMSYDLVIVAIEKSTKYQDRIGAVLASFIDKTGQFRLSGSIGGGFSDQERRMFYDWAERNKSYEDEERIWVDPFKEPLIIEVEAVEVNIKDRPKLEFKDRKWVEIEQDISGVLRFPQFLRVRDDKEPKYTDVRLDQLPIQSMDIIASHIEPGKWIQIMSGDWGQILEISSSSENDRRDCNLVVKWNPPLFGEISVSECHSTEVVRIR